MEIQGSKEKGKQREHELDGVKEENEIEGIEEGSSSFSLVAYSVGTGVMLPENFLQKCSMGYILYLWISLLEPTLETFYRPQI